MATHNGPPKTDAIAQKYFALALDLDAESVAVINRAAPLPPPPPGAQHSFVVEVAFGKGN